MGNQYKVDISFDKRKTLAEKIRRSYTDRVPVIVYSSGSNEVKLSKSKYIVPADTTVGGFLYQLRKQVNLEPEEAVFLFCDSGTRGQTLAHTSALIGDLDRAYIDEDKFLYFAITRESTFGF